MSVNLRQSYCTLFISVLSILVLLYFEINIASSHQDISTEIDTQTEIIELNDDYAALYLSRAELHRQNMDWIEALADYDSAEQRGFNKVELDYYRGRMFFEAERYTNAAYHLDSYLEKRPDSPNALIVRSKIPTQDPMAAVDDLNHAIALLDNPIPDLYLARARLLLSESSDNFDQIMHGIDEGLTRLGPVVTLIDFGIELCEKSEVYAVGLELIDRLPEGIKQQAIWQVRSGELFLGLKQYDKARERYQSALVSLRKMPESRRSTYAMSKIEKEILAKFATYNW